MEVYTNTEFHFGSCPLGDSCRGAMALAAASPRNRRGSLTNEVALAARKRAAEDAAAGKRTICMYRVAQKKRTPFRGSGVFPDFWLFHKILN